MAELRPAGAELRPTSERLATITFTCGDAFERTYGVNLSSGPNGSTLTISGVHTGEGASINNLTAQFDREGHLQRIELTTEASPEGVPFGTSPISRVICDVTSGTAQNETGSELLPAEKLQVLSLFNLILSDVSANISSGRNDQLPSLMADAYAYVSQQIENYDYVSIADYGGQIKSIVLTFPGREMDRNAYESFLRGYIQNLPEDVTIYISTSQRNVEKVQSILNDLGIYDTRIHIITSQDNVAPSSWARDSMMIRSNQVFTMITMPSSQESQDEAAAVSVAEENALDTIRHEQVSVTFQGGDIVTNGRYVFVGYETIARNLRETNLTEQEIITEFERLTGREVVVIGSAENPQPAFHIDLFMTALDDNTIAVADPGLTIDIVGGMSDTDRRQYEHETNEFFSQIGIDRFASANVTSFEVQREDGSYERIRLPFLDATVEMARSQDEAMDSVADFLADMGYNVVRVPYAFMGQGMVNFTYNNVITEERDGKNIVYMPTYGLDSLDSAAVRAYQEAGFEVVPIDSRAISTLRGTVRCSTQVLERE